MNALPDWHPFVDASHIEESLPSATIGCVRNFQLKETGGTIREQLLALSDAEHSCTYSILEAPMPVSNYVATFRLIPITTANETFGQWQASFDVPDDEQAATIKLVTDVFEQGFSNISKLLNP
jgi:hypothetical protein